MPLGLRTFAPVGCDTDGIVTKTPRPTIGCDTDGIVAKTPKPTIGCDIPKDDETENTSRFQKALQTLAAMKLFRSTYNPIAPNNAYTAPDFGFGPGVMPGSTGMWAVPPMTTPGVPGGIMM